MANNRTILVIDDQIGPTGGLHQKSFLRNYEKLPFNFLFESCASGDGFDPKLALTAVETNPEIDLILLDLKFGNHDELLGFEILRRLVPRFPSLPILVMSSVDRDVEALGRCLEDGAVGFIEKHRSAAYLQTAVEQAISLMQSHVLLGQSPLLRELRRQAARLSPYDQIPVLIIGERGTGKERVARYIHHSGPRSQGPFVAVNCAGVPESLFEGEFFGAEKGAYTGATVTRAGYFERAHGGTLFLDEIGNMPFSMQAKLLRVLQDRTFFRLGSTEQEITASFQLISATNVEPTQLLQETKLREDLYDRIAAVTVRTPSLRDCLDDVPLLANHFLQRLVGDKKRLSSKTVDQLARYDWPGNVRELQRVVQEAVVRSEDAATILPAHLPAKVVAGGTKGRRKHIRHLQSEPGTTTESRNWARERLLAELRIALEAKHHIAGYKGGQWKAEFMRHVYPHSKAQNAKGFSDLINRLTKGPWGDPQWQQDPEVSRLLRELQE